MSPNRHYAARELLFLPTEIEKPVEALVCDEYPVSYAQGLLRK